MWNLQHWLGLGTSFVRRATDQSPLRAVIERTGDSQPSYHTSTLSRLCHVEFMSWIGDVGLPPKVLNEERFLSKLSESFMSCSSDFTLWKMSSRDCSNDSIFPSSKSTEIGSLSVLFLKQCIRWLLVQCGVCSLLFVLWSSLFLHSIRPMWTLLSFSWNDSCGSSVSYKPPHITRTLHYKDITQVKWPKRGEFAVQGMKIFSTPKQLLMKS